MNICNPSSLTPMHDPSRVKRLIVLAALGAFGAAGSALADPVNLTYTGNGLGQVVHVSLGAQSWDVFAGRLNHSASGGTGNTAGLPTNITTFCADIQQGHASGPTSYNSTTVASASGNAGLSTLGAAKQQAIYEIYKGAGDLQFTQFSGFAAAFQLAVWEVVNDFNAALPNNGLSIAGGNFRATALGQASLSAAMADKVAFLLSWVGTGSGTNQLMGLANSAYQDQFYQGVVVPLPAAVWVGMGGLGLAVGFQWRRRREQGRMLLNA